MKYRIVLLLSILPVLFFFTDSCKFPEDEMLEIAKDTSTIAFSERGLLLDTKTSKGLADANVSIFAIITQDSNQLLQTGKTDSNGFFHLKFTHLKFNAGFLIKLSHPNPVFMDRSYSTKNYREKANDSTALYYLHRKAACMVSLKNSDGKQKNVMLFNESRKFSKLLMNLRKDTSFFYLLPDYKDNIYMDYFPQTNLQKQVLNGSTSGDTIRVEFKY